MPFPRDYSEDRRYRLTLACARRYDRDREIHRAAFL